MDVTQAALIFMALWLLGLTLKTNLHGTQLREAARHEDTKNLTNKISELSALFARLDERSASIQLQLAGIHEYFQQDRNK